MKIGGIQVSPCEEILVLPRNDGDDIVIRAKAVRFNEEFDKRVPEPVAPNIRTKNGSAPDYKDKNYKEAVNIRNNQRFAYMIIRSLEPSNIEWEKVNLDDPKTWTKWDQELIEAGLSEVEISRITKAVMVANSLDEAKIEEARKNFLHGQGA
jgi:hypothetical protein